MTARKQFSTNLTITPEMKRRLEAARKVEVTEEMLREQRISFVYGNLMGRSTKERVRRTASRMRLL
jgi:hypothetical protein